MKLYKLECWNQDGNLEDNGYFLFRENAEKAKLEMDNYPINKQYGIIQHIVEIYTQDGVENEHH